MAASTNPPLTATYTAPSAENKVFEFPLPACPKSPSTEERTASIAALRANVSTLQDQVNAFLTHKMEDDKNAAAAINDEKEEENYGEEVVD
jgi:hypothetical protein